jgi:hypothetical protein
VSDVVASYSGDPSASAVDEVRHLTGDTDVRAGHNLFEDEQILYALDKAASDPSAAAYALLRQAAARAAVAPSQKTIGDTTIVYPQNRADMLRQRADDLLPGATYNARTVGVSMGGSTSAAFVRRDQVTGIVLDWPESST